MNQSSLHLCQIWQQKIETTKAKLLQILFNADVWLECADLVADEQTLLHSLHLNLILETLEECLYGACVALQTMWLKSQQNI